MTAIVVHGDARQLLLPDASVDLIVTSPPYFALRSYTDGGEHYAGQIGSEATPAEYTAALIACTREWMRVLKPTGSMFVNLGDSYARQGQDKAQSFVSGDVTKAPRQRLAVNNGVRLKSLQLLPERYRIACVDELGLIARAVIVWDKPNGLPESVTDRVRRSHEDWVHLTKLPRYFAAVDEIREQSTPQRGLAGTFKRPQPSHALVPGQAVTQHRADRADAHAYNPLGKLPGSVWEIASQPLKVPAELGVDHFAAFPMEWPRRIVKAWSPQGGVVLDPFGGTGTTALVSSALGRIGISVDMSADYCRIARWRTTDPAQRAKALGVEKPPVEVRGQAELFTLDA